MNDDQMRTRIDEVLARVDRKLKRRRLGPVAKTGVAVGLAAVVESCSKMLPPEEAQPVYGVEVDAAARDAAADAADPEAGVLYGFMDADSFDQPIYPPYSIPDAGMDEMGVLYGFLDAGVDAAVDAAPIPPYGLPPDASVDDAAVADDVGLGDIMVIYGVPDAGYTGDVDEVDAMPIPPYGLPPDSGE